MRGRVEWTFRAGNAPNANETPNVNETPNKTPNVNTASTVGVTDLIRKFEPSYVKTRSPQDSSRALPSPKALPPPRTAVTPQALEPGSPNTEISSLPLPSTRSGSTITPTRTSPYPIKNVQFRDDERENEFKAQIQRLQEENNNQLRELTAVKGLSETLKDRLERMRKVCVASNARALPGH